MSRLIDADGLKRHFTADSGTFIERVLLEAVDLQPTAFDVNKVAYEKNAIRRKSVPSRQKIPSKNSIRRKIEVKTHYRMRPQKP